MGWGIQNFKTPGSPWGGGFEIPWGTPKTANETFLIERNDTFILVINPIMCHNRAVLKNHFVFNLLNFSSVVC